MARAAQRVRAADHGPGGERQHAHLVAGLDADRAVDRRRERIGLTRVHDFGLHVGSEPNRGAVAPVQIEARQTALESEVDAGIDAEPELAHGSQHRVARVEIDAEHPAVHRHRLGTGVLAEHLGGGHAGQERERNGEHGADRQHAQGHGAPPLGRPGAGSHRPKSSAARQAKPRAAASRRPG